MKYLKASIICFICAAVTIWLMGCSNLYNSTPEFSKIQDAHLRTYQLAAQVKGTERVSQADKVRIGERFYANCDTYSKTVADLLINDYGADPSEVWLVQVDIPVAGFVWEQRSGEWHRVKADRHQVVLYHGLIADNKWQAIVTMKDLEWDYNPVKKMNMEDQVWVAM